MKLQYCDTVTKRRGHLPSTCIIASLTQEAAAAPGGNNALSVVEHVPLGPCKPENGIKHNQITGNKTT
jgi:hypothetical protein